MNAWATNKVGKRLNSNAPKKRSPCRLAAPSALVPQPGETGKEISETDL